MPDSNLPDKVHTPFDANLSPPLSFANSQQNSREPNNQIIKPQLAKIIPPSSPFDATSSQNAKFSQPSLTSCLLRQPVKDYNQITRHRKFYFYPK